MAFIVKGGGGKGGQMLENLNLDHSNACVFHHEHLNYG